jgi:enolase
MATIESVHAREILDSRGYPTVEVSVGLAGGAVGSAAVPSGASTGEREAVELRDGEPKRYAGKGVLRAVANVNDVLAAAVRGLDAADQATVDATLIARDGTENKGRLGANALLGVSLAVARAAAVAAGRSLYRALGGEGATLLPVPLMNVINGGRHAANSLDFQEFMIVPHGAPAFAEGIRWGVEVYHALRDLLTRRHLTTAVGDEGGFAPELGSHEEALDLLVEAIRGAGFVPGRDVSLALDAAASELADGGGYVFKKSGGPHRSADELIALYERWCAAYPLVSIEDGLGENDWAGWQRLTAALGKRVQLVGDDVFVTNEKILARGIAEGVANAILIKVNQIGTLTETRATMARAAAGSYRNVVSHRSGETEDTFIADLAVATGAGQIKTGAPCRSERTAKYNRLLAIAEELGSRARYGGVGFGAGGGRLA